MCNLISIMTRQYLFLLSELILALMNNHTQSLPDKQYLTRLLGNVPRVTLHKPNVKLPHLSFDMVLMVSWCIYCIYRGTWDPKSRDGARLYRFTRCSIADVSLGCCEVLRWWQLQAQNCYLIICASAKGHFYDLYWHQVAEIMAPELLEMPTSDPAP